VTPTVTTKVVGAAVIAPVLGWGVKPPSSTFTVNREGSLVPDTTSLSQMEYGVSAHPDLRNPPTFLVNFPVPGQFTMSIVQGSPTGAKAAIHVDGSTVREIDVPIGECNLIMTVNIPAGLHSIMIDSTASDWYQVGNFIFSNYTTELQAYALSGSSKVFGWVRSRAHTWWQVKNGMYQPAIVDGVVSLSICKKSSTWNVQWWNTTSGEVTRKEQVSCSCTGSSCNPLQLAVLPIDSKSANDWAFKLILVGTK